MPAEFQNPVHFADGKWFFWDETWTHAYGPFESEAQAIAELDRYCEVVLGHPADRDALSSS